jgi:hypothetical protein
MFSRIRRIVFGIGVVAMTIGWIGCSDTTKITTSSNQESAVQVVYYFPLNEGDTTVFDVTISGITEQKTFVMSGTVKLGISDAQSWVISSGGNVDTSYLVATDSALYFLETPNASPEKILSLPLTPGASWPRYYNYDVTGYYYNYDYYGDLGTGTGTGTGTDTTSGNGQPFGNADSSTTGGDVAAKNYPSDGANTFTVVGTDSVALGTLGSFPDAVKISNIGYGGTTNLYWYVPGIGLVKYMIGTNSDGTATPEVEGTLVARN